MVKKLRILYTIPNFNTAGSGKVVYDLVKGLDDSQFEIEIACGNNKGQFFKTIEALGYPIHIFETKTAYRPWITLPFRIFRISKFYLKHDYDLIHSWQWSNDWTEALAAKWVGKKWIYTKKAMGFANKHWKIKSFLADFIITINDEMSHYFSYKKAQQLIPLGIDTAYYSPEHFNNLEKKTNTFTIITVANLVPVKGIEVLLKALAHVKDETMNLLVLGDNDNAYGKSLLDLTKALHLEHQVTFLGKTSDVRPYIAKSDLYVIPTLNEGRKEGMPMALVEAMSMGVPLLGSNISGINFVLKDFKPMLFEAGNFEDLATKIKALQNKSQAERLEIGQTLRAYCIKNFSLEAFLDAHEILYKQLVK